MIFTSSTINYTKEIYIPPYINSYENCLFFHIETTGHYWRNSYIENIFTLHKVSSNEWIKMQWTSEKESDEYDMLKIFAEVLQKYSTIIGFNSTSFHLPYLEQKYKAYGLISPLTDKIHYDQLKEIRAIGKKLHISTKLTDLRIYFNLHDSISDIECIVIAGNLFSISQILNGDFNILQTELLSDEVLFTCETTTSFPAEIRIHNAEFYLMGTKNILKIKVKLSQGKIKLYYPNYKDYFYLSEENMVIHKSLASVIAKNKKIRATKENCFTYIQCNNHFLNNSQSQKKYLDALLQHYMST